MVSYGDRDFREWAVENGFDDADLKLIKNTAAKRSGQLGIIRLKYIFFAI